MSQLFFGYFLILFNYNLTIAGFTFDVLPNFIGYFFLLRAVKELAPENESFRKSALPVQIMLVVSAAVWVLNGIGLLGKVAAVRTITLSLVDLTMLFILYTHIKGISGIESATGYLMKGAKLRRDWLVIAVATVLTHISVYNIVAIVGSYIQLIFAVIFLFDLSTAVKGYNQKIEAPKPQADSGEGAAEGDRPDGADAPDISFTADESEPEDEENT